MSFSRSGRFSMACSSACMNWVFSAIRSGRMPSSPAILPTSSAMSSMDSVSKRSASPRSFCRSSVSIPMNSASSPRVGSRPRRVASSLEAWEWLLLIATAERGKYDMRRTSSIIEPLMRICAKFSNGMPLLISKDLAASISPSMPACISSSSSMNGGTRTLRCSAMRLTRPR